MNQFYDENIYYDNYYPPMNQGYPINNKTKTRINLQKTLHYTSRTIYTINQVIPLVYQLRPIINNAKNAYHVIQAVNHINDIDFDEVEKNITPITEKNKSNEPIDDLKFENMVQ